MPFPDDQALAQAVQSGLQAGEFATYFQPKFDPDSEDIVGLEALLRWNHPEEGFLEAGRFMRAIERDAELIEAVDAWVLGDTMRQGRAWVDQDLSFGLMSVNISAWNNGKMLVDKVQSALKDSGFPAKKLSLECPWRVLAVDVAGISQTMRDLRALGCVIVLDGNPLNQECLDVVRQTPVQMSKVCIEHMQSLADSDGIEVLAQQMKRWDKAKVQIVSMGVESEEHVALSHNAGCRLFQGSRFKSALPGDEISFLLKLIAKTKKALSFL
ncbi:EAL domain-containing protein [Magnetovibrio sp.]|uniref:EAL domain-containing protein n=1 Tax=Magnetovibrio sp. TaxID=2024836 RepID=UPI002F9535BE